MHICVSKLTIIGSDNGLSPDRRQAIIWTNAGLLLIGPLGTNFSEILIGIQTFSSEFKHFHSRKCIWKCRLRNGVHLSRPQCVKAYLLPIGPHAENKFQWNFDQNTKLFFEENAIKNIVCRMTNLGLLTQSIPNDIIWHCRSLSTLVEVNGLVSDGTKSLSRPLLTSLHYGPRQHSHLYFHLNFLDTNHKGILETCFFKATVTFAMGWWITCN